MKNLFKSFLVFLIIFLIIAGVFSLINLEPIEKKEIRLSQLVEIIKKEELKEIIVEEDRLTVVLSDENQVYAFKESNQPIVTLLTDYGIESERLAQVSIKIKNKGSREFLLTIILPLLIPLLIFIGIFYFFSRQLKGAGMQAFKFGESRAKKVYLKNKKNRISFKDVAGIKEAKEELKEIIEFLKTPKKFISLGAKMPKGVLLIGPPGCGKTLLARAVAGEAEVPFFYLSGSEFVEMFVGIGASRVRDLFKKAKGHLPCIIFIDELDAVGRQRGAGLGGSHDEREQTLNQILVGLDGFESNTGLIVMAATNRPDILDPALLRPGRFDRKVTLSLPDINGREAILKIHARNKPLAPQVNLRKVAERTPGFSGADLESLLNEAAILSARRKLKQIPQKEILESIEKVLLGPERKSHLLSKKEKKIVAYHEAGHAIVGHFLKGSDPVQKISIISRGQAAGYTLKTPEQDRYLCSRSEFLDTLSALLGGYSSEEIFFKEVTTGAAQDLKETTKLARKLITKYGMSKFLGPRTFGEHEEMVFLGKEITERHDYSEKTAQKIDEEINEIIQDCHHKAKDILVKKKKIVEKLVQELLIKETIEKEEFLKIVD